MVDECKSLQHPVRARVGFGCSNLGSDLSYRESCALIETAYAAGFRHFDVAPSYGHGQAERVLGDVLRTVRNEVCLVTKAGISHPRGASSLQAVKRLLAPVKKLLPGLWASGAQRARRATAPRGQFSAAQVSASIQESLVRLRTQRIDWLLLHDITVNELSEETLRALADAIAAGHVNGVGLGTSVADTKSIIAAHPGTFGFLQVNHFWGAYVPQFHLGSKLVTHRVIREGTAIVRSNAFLRTLERDSICAALKEALLAPDCIVDLLLSASLRTNGVETVLVGSSKPARVRQFMKAADSASLNSLAAQLGAQLFAFYQAQRPSSNETGRRKS